MSAWLVKTRRAPSRHGRDARVYGHTTTAMHKLSTPPPPLPPPSVSFTRDVFCCCRLRCCVWRRVCFRWFLPTRNLRRTREATLTQSTMRWPSEKDPPRSSLASSYPIHTTLRGHDPVPRATPDRGWRRGGRGGGQRDNAESLCTCAFRV